jgi:hypothetical protein
MLEVTLYTIFPPADFFFHHNVLRLLSDRKEGCIPQNNNNNLMDNSIYRVHLAWLGFELTLLVVIGTDCVGSYKSNSLTIMATTVMDTLKS